MYRKMKKKSKTSNLQYTIQELEALKTTIIFLQNSYRVIWTMLDFIFGTELTLLGVNHFYTWRMVLPLSKYLSVQNILSFAFSMSGKISEISCNAKAFCQGYFLWDPFLLLLWSLSSTTLFFPSVPLAAHPEWQQGQCSRARCFWGFFYNSISFWLELIRILLPELLLVISLLYFQLYIGQIQSFVIYFCKI